MRKLESFRIFQKLWRSEDRRMKTLGTERKKHTLVKLGHVNLSNRHSLWRGQMTGSPTRRSEHEVTWGEVTKEVVEWRGETRWILDCCYIRPMNALMSSLNSWCVMSWIEFLYAKTLNGCEIEEEKRTWRKCFWNSWWKSRLYVSGK